jgi:hypothetical protein
MRDFRQPLVLHASFHRALSSILVGALENHDVVGDESSSFSSSGKEFSEAMLLHPDGPYDASRDRLDWPGTMQITPS